MKELEKALTQAALWDEVEKRPRIKMLLIFLVVNNRDCVLQEQLQSSQILY